MTTSDPLNRVDDLTEAHGALAYFVERGAYAPAVIGRFKREATAAGWPDDARRELLRIAKRADYATLLRTLARTMAPQYRERFLQSPEPLQPMTTSDAQPVNKFDAINALHSAAGYVALLHPKAIEGLEDARDKIAAALPGMAPALQKELRAIRDATRRAMAEKDMDESNALYHRCRKVARALEAIDEPEDRTESTEAAVKVLRLLYGLDEPNTGDPSRERVDALTKAHGALPAFLEGDGNAFAIIARFNRQAEAAGWPEDARREVVHHATRADYETLLHTFAQTMA